MDRKAIEFFSDIYPYDFPEPISLAWAIRGGLTVRECGVQMRSRNNGQSSILGFKTVIYMLRGIGYVILARIIRPIKT